MNTVFFPPRHDNYTDIEWQEAMDFLDSHQLNPHNIPAREPFEWDDAAGTLRVTEWIRNDDGKLRLSGSNEVASRAVTIKAEWADLPAAWQRAARAAR